VAWNGAGMHRNTGGVESGNAAMPDGASVHPVGSLRLAPAMLGSSMYPAGSIMAGARRAANNRADVAIPAGHLAIISRRRRETAQRSDFPPSRNAGGSRRVPALGAYGSLPDQVAWCRCFGWLTRDF